MNKGEKKRPAIVHNPFAVLTPKEKEWLRSILTDDRYIKMMGVVQKFRPKSACAKAGSGERDAFSNERAAARLSEMAGWDKYETALFAVLLDSPLIAREPEPTYPDSGRLDANWGQTPPDNTAKT